MFRFFRRPEPPPSPSEAGRVLSASAHSDAARARRRAKRDRIVKAHCASIIASMTPNKEPTYEQ